MDSIFKLAFAECSNGLVVQEGIEKCPFLRKIKQSTVFSFSSASFQAPVRGAKRPLFEDAPDFEVAFRLFHGQNGVVPLAGRSSVFDETHGTENTETGPQFDPLAARAATISLSAFGAGGPFGFDTFSEKWNKQSKKASNYEPISQDGGNKPSHESLSNEWLETGQCPIAKSYRAVSGVIPLVTKFIRPPPGLKLKCPPTVVVVRAALSLTETGPQFDPLAARAAAISLSALGASGPFGFDSLSTKWNKQNKKASNYEPISQSGGYIASCCTVGISPVTKFNTHSSCLKLRFPPAVVAVRASPSRTEPSGSIPSQPPSRLMVAIVTAFGMVAGTVLRWIQRSAKFSLEWITPKAAMQSIFTLMESVPTLKAVIIAQAAFILGLKIGSAYQKVLAVKNETGVKNRGKALDSGIGANALIIPNELSNSGDMITIQIKDSTFTYIADNNVSKG